MWKHETRGRVATIEGKTKRYPTDLTDAEWERIAPLLPRPSRRGCKPGVDMCDVYNAIRFMTRRGSRWRMLPKSFPPWQAYRQSGIAWMNYARSGPFRPMSDGRAWPRQSTG